MESEQVKLEYRFYLAKKFGRKTGAFSHSSVWKSGSQYYSDHRLNLLLASKQLYRGPTLSGHPQQRPTSLMWPQVFATATMNAVISSSRQRPPL